MAAPRDDLVRFRDAIVHQIGLQFDDTKLGFLGEVLQRRLNKLGHSSDDYLSALESRPSDGECPALARELTVGETYFFRNIEQFRVLAEVVLPERMSARGAAQPLRLLSAGCASGEEPYSIAMVAKETAPAWDIEIRAVDINPAALQKALHARYSAWALRETPRRRAEQMVSCTRPRPLARQVHSQCRALRHGQSRERRSRALAARAIRCGLLPERLDVFLAGADACGDHEDRAFARTGRLSLPRSCRDSARRFRAISSLPQPRNVLLLAQGWLALNEAPPAMGQR
jgi:CheR methyltransferase, SAM binding domain